MILVVSTCAGAALWATGLPGHLLTANWFFPVRWRGLDASPWVLALAPLLLATAAGAMRSASRGRHGRALALLVATSVIAQTSALLLVGPRLETAIARFEGGHGTFLVAAHAKRDAILESIREYPARAEAGELGPFAPSKPPGTFAYYALIDAISELPRLRDALEPLRAHVEARPALRPRADAVTAAIVIFPLTTALVVLPIVLLGLALTGRAAAGYDAALLWATCPAVLVVTHHTDGALYPLLVTLAAALAGLGARRRSLVLSCLGGTTCALAIWCSYGLLPSVGLAIGAQLVATLDSMRGKRLADTARHVAVHAAATLGGLALGFAALDGAGLFPAAVEGYRSALLYHYRWKLGYVGGRYGLTGGIEFWAWSGFVLFVAFAIACAAAARRARSASTRPVALAAWGVLAVHAVVMLFGGSNESARLWLFQLPFVALVVATDLRIASPVGRPRWLLTVAVLANLVMTPVVRAAQVW